MGISLLRERRGALPTRPPQALLRRALIYGYQLLLTVKYFSSPSSSLKTPIYQPQNMKKTAFTNQPNDERCLLFFIG